MIHVYILLPHLFNSNIHVDVNFEIFQMIDVDLSHFPLLLCLCCCLDLALVHSVCLRLFVSFPLERERELTQTGKHVQKGAISLSLSHHSERGV